MTWLLYGGVGLLIALMLAGGTAKADENTNPDKDIPISSNKWIALPFEDVSKYLEGFVAALNAKVGDTVSLSLKSIEKASDGTSKYAAVVSGVIRSGDAGWNIRINSFDSGAGGSEKEINFPIPSMYNGAPINSIFKPKTTLSV